MGYIILKPLRRLLSLPIEAAFSFGAVDRTQATKVLWVGKDKDGVWKYRQHVPATLIHDAKQETYKDPHGHEHRHMWWRHEVVVEALINRLTGASEKGGQTVIRPGDHLVVAEHPSSSGWWHSARFKSRGGDRRPPQPGTGFESAQEFVEWTESLGVDYWESGKFYVAGFVEPEQRLSLPSPTRRRHAGSKWAVGCCEDPEAVVRELWASEAVRSLLKATGERLISVWKPGIPQLEPKLTDETASFGPSFMDISLRQALAGPPDNSDTWVGRPVIDWAKVIYRDHLNDHNRKEARRLGLHKSMDNAPTANEVARRQHASLEDEVDDDLPADDEEEAETER